MLAHRGRISFSWFVLDWTKAFWAPLFQGDGARFIRDFFEGCTNDVVYLFKRSGTITRLESCPRFGHHSLPDFSNMCVHVCIYVFTSCKKNVIVDVYEEIVVDRGWFSCWVTMIFILKRELDDLVSQMIQWIDVKMILFWSGESARKKDWTFFRIKWWNK